VVLQLLKEDRDCIFQPHFKSGFSHTHTTSNNNSVIHQKRQERIKGVEKYRERKEETMRKRERERGRKRQ